ncbi:putative constitutes one of the two catalytic subunit of the tRNA-splicing endonuclease complex, a complex responsible for identification and cleavage of the splice sites in pre-tRNA [Lyophyllum shimeji]|uniref:tRNA-splicing endonuclease subunit Sen34 n=1 Tax=Lyophyllum shimeji TaxID=47721 RepID=A0A9P3PHA7_LYOSH|nr:putative constitutes one of the two catalytic subunit of the tRNA-splicing endonuclease complex, a complex responsible for identification and cleavage of the splice sites in pre-tRNA [Lyophyllum shimeji]
MSTAPRRIPLRVSNKKAFIWDVDDIATIRSKHRLCGVLSGTLPHLSQQNVFLGVPLVLMPEEVVLLVENELAVLVDDVKAHRQPTSEELEEWNLEQQEDIKRQMALLEVKGAKESANAGRAMSAEALMKRQAREAKRAAKAKLAETTGDPDSLGAMLAPEAGTPRPPPPRSQESTEIKAASFGHTVVIPASSSSLPWYDPSSASYSTIASAKAAGIWDYPSTLQERARCGVFRSLWEQGYFMGGGIKFGGDYLVYPGDPLRYHSHFAASVLDSPSSSLRPMEVVAHGRLGTATKKAHLLCCWDDDKKEVSYLTIEWAGFG